MREDIFVALNHRLCVHSLYQPQEQNIMLNCTFFYFSCDSRMTLSEVCGEDCDLGFGEEVAQGLRESRHVNPLCRFQAQRCFDPGILLLHETRASECCEQCTLLISVHKRQTYERRDPKGILPGRGLAHFPQSRELLSS